MTRTRFLAVSAWFIVCLFLFVNPVGLWPFIPFVALGVLAELSNLVVAWQMRSELRQVLDARI